MAVRVCSIGPDLNLEVRDEPSRSGSDRSGGEETPEERQVQTAPLINGYSLGYRRGMRGVYRVFRELEERRWLPTALALIPLWIYGTEIQESLLSCDPDVVDVTRVRWRREMRRALARWFPRWTCVTRAGSRIEGADLWRKTGRSPKVSIVLPTYNGLAFFGQSLASCVEQTYPNIEVLVVDDGSTQDIRAVVAACADPRIRYLRHDTNLGLAEALNTGFRSCTGEYLTWTSDDNRYAPTAIAEMVRFLQSYSEIDLVYADRFIVGVEHAPTNFFFHRPAVELPTENCVGACFMYRRKVYEAIGDYDAQAVLAEDYDYWLRVARRFRMQRLLRRLYYYRYHPDSLTSRFTPAQVHERVRWVKQKNRIRIGGEA